MSYAVTPDATSVSSSQDLSGFLSIARHLRSVMEHENAIFSENGEFNLENYVRKKMELMTRFEQEARNLLKAWGEDEKNPMRLRLLTEIEQVSHVMRQNSLQQLAALKSKRHASTAANSAASENTGEDTCH